MEKFKVLIILIKKYWLASIIFASLFFIVIMLQLFMDVEANCGTSPWSDFKDKYCYSNYLNVVARPVSLQPFSLLYPSIFKKLHVFNGVESESFLFPFVNQIKDGHNFSNIVKDAFLFPAGFMGVTSVLTSATGPILARSIVFGVVWFADVVYLAVLSYFLVLLWRRAWWGKVMFLFFMFNKIFFISSLLLGRWFDF